MDGAFAPPLIVSPSTIESSLDEIWKTLASREGGAKMRACLFNLILVTKDTPRAAYIRGVAETVIAKFPCRILFINIEKGKKEESLRTSVSVVGVSGQSSDVACDLIEFVVAEASTDRIFFTVLPHLIPDLPVYLLWAEDPIKDNPLSHQLETLASRLIFDSEATDNLPLFAKSLLHHREVTKSDIADMNWARSENWRTLLISTFSSPQRLEELQDTISLKIEYNALETTFFCHTIIQSIYLQGWLACQLGWHFQEMEKKGQDTFFKYNNAKGQLVTVELVRSVTKDLAPGAITTLTLVTSGEGNFKFVRTPDKPQQVTMYLCSQDRCSMPTQFVLAKGGIGLTLVKEICRKGTNTHYLRLLEFLARLEKQWKE